LRLDESSLRAGAHSWWERRLFEVLGGWVPAAATPAVKVMLDRHAGHAAWRSAQWWDRLPVMAGVDRQELVAAPGSRAERVVEMAASAGDDVTRLAGAYRLMLPRVAAGYRAHRGEASAVSDGPAIRTLAMVEADLVSDWLEGETLLQTMLSASDAVKGAARWVERLETLLVT
jgi:hypothetical protein